MKKIFFLLVLFSFFLFGCGDVPASSETTYVPDNGDLNNTFINAPDPVTLTPEQEVQQEIDKLLAEGWQADDVQNGPLPACYNFKPKKGSFDNALQVTVGGGTDVAIKVMNMDSEKCVRYVFINSGTTYSIRNIPEGKYYLKIAYGKNWLSKVENGQCVGKFISNPMYEKGEDILDYNVRYTSDGYNVPSYRLQLDVISSNTANSFNSSNISESDFNQ